MKYLVPDYVYSPEGLQTNKAISISDDGRITAILAYTGGRFQLPAGSEAAEIDLLP